jgi:hypothetical protein
MKKHIIPGFMLLAVFLWAGMILGISFIEAPVKFTAPNVTLAIGLGIGRLVFGVMNKVEIAFCAVLLSGIFFQQFPKTLWFTAAKVALILALQSVWLLPALDVRALAVIAGENPGPSNLHFIYVALEFIKFGLLLLAGFQIFKAVIQQATIHPMLKKNTYRKPITA